MFIEEEKTYKEYRRLFTINTYFFYITGVTFTAENYTIYETIIHLLCVLLLLLLVS